MTARIAIVEDNHDLRRRFIERIRFFEDIHLVLVAGSGERFFEMFRELAPAERPHVVLMDIELPGMSGIETTVRLKEAAPEVEVLMLTVFEDEDKIFASLQAGASGYLLKDATTDAVVGAILELIGGGAPLSGAIARRMLRFVREQQAPPEAPQRFALTQRERELLEHLVRDETEAMIADHLGISAHTVRAHVKNIYRKLEVHSRSSAVRVALQYRLAG